MDEWLLDRAPYEALDEDGDEDSDPGGTELAVEASDPSLEVSSGDLFARVPLLKSADDLRNLHVVHGLQLRLVQTRAVERGWSWRTELGGRAFGKLHC